MSGGKAKEKSNQDKTLNTVDVIAKDSVCRRCKYHSKVGAGEYFIACMYAAWEGKCRTLEEGYIPGRCRHFTPGKPTHEGWMKNKRIALGGNNGYNNM